MMCNYMRFGGVARDLSEKPTTNTMDFLILVHNRLPKAFDALHEYLTERDHQITLCRSRGVAASTSDSL